MGVESSCPCHATYFASCAVARSSNRMGRRSCCGLAMGLPRPILTLVSSTKSIEWHCQFGFTCCFWHARSGARAACPANFYEQIDLDDQKMLPLSSNNPKSPSGCNLSPRERHFTCGDWAWVDARIRELITEEKIMVRAADNRVIPYNQP